MPPKIPPLEAARRRRPSPAAGSSTEQPADQRRKKRSRPSPVAGSSTKPPTIPRCKKRCPEEHDGDAVGVKIVLHSQVTPATVQITKLEDINKAMHIQEDLTIEGMSEPEEVSSLIQKKKFVLPRLDDSKLIIEELQMGDARSNKAKLGSKVSLSCSYKTEDGETIRTQTHEFVLGSGEVLEGLHEGICGMRFEDKRRLTIPRSLRHEGISICEITMGKIDG